MDPEKEEPVGSVPVNPLPENTEEEETPPAAPETDKGDEGQPNAGEDRVAQLEQMLNDSQAMIGRQSSEVGALRQELADLKAAKPEEPAGPSIQDQIDDISQKMENGDVDMREGNRQIAMLSAQMGEENALRKFSEQQEQQSVQQVQQQFLRENPDYEKLRDSGELKPYMDADPLADEYVAYKQYKADQDKARMKEEYETKIAAAKEEGAKLAQGADEAGRVLGKSGTAARTAATAPNKPFKNQQEAHDAMLAKLQEVRSGSAQ